MKRLLTILLLLCAGRAFGASGTNVLVSALPATNAMQSADQFVIQITNKPSAGSNQTSRIPQTGQFGMTNTNNYFSASNFVFAANQNGFARLVWNGATLTSPDEPLFSFFGNLLHGGHGNGTEWQFTGNQAASSVDEGSHWQYGNVSHSNEFYYVAHATTPQGNATPTNFAGHSHFWGYQYTYAGTNGTGLGGWIWTHATNVNNGTGEAVYQIFATAADKTQNVGSFSSFGPANLNLGDNGLAQPQNNFVQPFAIDTLTGTNYFLNWTNAHAVEIDLATNCLFVETNLAAATNKIQNGFQLEKDLWVKSDVSNRALYYPANWQLLSVSGTNTLPTNIPSATIYHFHLYETLGTGTNTYVKLDSGTNTAIYDANAQAFFTAAGITDTTQKSAVNSLVIAMKADGTWALADCIYPYVGGTSSTESYNLKNPAAFQIAFHGGMTFNANGITGNGTDAWGDTGFLPSTAGGNFTLNSATIAVYLKTTGLATGDLMLAQNDTGPIRSGILSAGSANQWEMQGPNSTGGTAVAITASPTTGFICATRTSSSVQAFYINAQTAAGSETSSTLQSGSSIGILARNDAGQDHFAAANLAFGYIGAGLDSTHEANLNTDVLNFETTLGRQ